MNRLLLADDSVTMQRLVELILADEGFEIKATTNGDEAFAALSSFKPDIVLADVEMPKINGYQLCKRIKQDSSTSNIPVILLAGAFEPFDEVLAQQVKANDFIIKPFESQELLNKIRTALTAAAAVEEEVVGVTEAPIKEEVAEEEDLWAMEEILETEEVEAQPEEVEVGREEAAMEREEEVVAVEEGPGEAHGLEVEEAVPAERAEILEVELPSKDELKEIFEKAVTGKISSLVSSIDIKETIHDSLVPLMKDYIKGTLPDLTEGMLKETIESPLKSFQEEFRRVIGETLPDLSERVLKETLEEFLRSLSEEVKKVMDKIAFDLTERMTKEMLEVSLTKITEEVEKVIWKTVPEIAERLISREIERIRSEF
jgi:DNA-binding response OmpR family regulator